MTEHITLQTPPSSLDTTKKWFIGIAVLWVDDFRNVPEVLLVNRAAHTDFLAGFWELPAGKVDATDPNIAATVTRVLKGKTGFDFKKTLKRVKDITWVDGSGTPSVQLNYVVEIEDLYQPPELCAERQVASIWIREMDLENWKIAQDMESVVREALECCKGEGGAKPRKPKACCAYGKSGS